MSTRLGVVSRLVCVAAFSAAVVGLAAVAAATVSGQSGSTALGDGIGTPRFTTDESVNNFSANADTIPYWRSSFTDSTNGITYPMTVIGAHRDSEVSTVVPTVIIPMSFTFVTSASHLPSRG